MDTKLISPRVHSLIDYGFAAALFVLPTLLKTSDKNKQMYTTFANSIVIYTGITDQPVSFKRIIPFKLHGVVDHISLAGLVLQLFSKSIRRDKAALAIQLGFVTLGALNVFLTNWNADTGKKKP